RSHSAQMAMQLRMSPATLVISQGRAQQVERPLAKRPIDRGHHAIARELALVTQEADDAVEVRLERTSVERARDIGREIDPADFVEDCGFAERVADLGWHAVDATVPLHELQRLLRADAF